MGSVQTAAAAAAAESASDRLDVKLDSNSLQIAAD